MENAKQNQLCNSSLGIAEVRRETWFVDSGHLFF